MQDSRRFLLSHLVQFCCRKNVTATDGQCAKKFGNVVVSLSISEMAKSANAPCIHALPASSFPEIAGDLPHPAGLRHLEGASSVTIPAADAVGGVFRELLIVIRRHAVPDFGQIVIFVDKPDIQTRRAGPAVVAVYAGSKSVLWRKGADCGIIPFLLRCGQNAQCVLHILEAADAGQNGQYARLIQRILDALAGG